MSDGQRCDQPVTVQCCLLLNGSRDDQHFTLSVTPLAFLLNCARDRRKMNHPMRHCGFHSPNSHPTTVTCTPQPYSFTCLPAFLGHSEKSNFSFLGFHLFSKHMPLTLGLPQPWGFLTLSTAFLPSRGCLSIMHHTSLTIWTARLFFLLSSTLFFWAAAEVYYLPAMFYFYWFF